MLIGRPEAGMGDMLDTEDTDEVDLFLFKMLPRRAIGSGGAIFLLEVGVAGISSDARLDSTGLLGCSVSIRMLVVETEGRGGSSLSIVDIPSPSTASGTVVTFGSSLSDGFCSGVPGV
jgi:hypothetical protein